MKSGATGHYSRILNLFSLFIFMSLFAATFSSASAESITACPNRILLLQDKAYFQALIEAIDQARNEIVMSFFYFKTNGRKSNYPDRILQHLTKASQRGVRVAVVLEISSNPRSQLDQDNRATAHRLKQGGIRVFLDSPRTKTHTKVAVIDKRHTFIGSHNLTASALKYNHELSILIDSPEVARETLSYIHALH